MAQAAPSFLHAMIEDIETGKAPAKVRVAAPARQAIAAALAAYRAVRARPVIGGSLAYFIEKEARRADVRAAVSDARVSA